MHILYISVIYVYCNPPSLNAKYRHIYIRHRHFGPTPLVNIECLTNWSFRTFLLWTQAKTESTFSYTTTANGHCLMEELKLLHAYIWVSTFLQTQGELTNKSVVLHFGKEDEKCKISVVMTHKTPILLHPNFQSIDSFRTGHELRNKVVTFELGLIFRLSLVFLTFFQAGHFRMRNNSSSFISFIQCCLEGPVQLQFTCFQLRLLTVGMGT